ncbi:hypothetical protein UCRPC4_g01942 [Phaeomoniella chlamydospora]|uniref:Uncharacterized protein n=1 Tax=Phaeomoniella chlamydospora TaxID=158046 RepID=A0A0G2GPL6_PHACM|nr:hypothetical protein UCRPC4_g01942 [Phaeomoniella chlamydospora]
MNELDFEALINFDFDELGNDVVNSIPVSSDESYNDERGDGDVSQDIPMGARATDSPKIFVLVDEEGSEVAEASEFPDSRNPRAKRATWRQCSLRARPHRAGKPKNFKPYEQYDEFCESHHEAFGEPPRKRRAPSVRKKAESSNLVLQSVDITTLLDALRGRVEKDKKQHDSKLAEQEQRHQEKLNRIEEAHKLESHTWTLKLAGAQAELEMSQERITKLQAELQTTKLELQNSLSKEKPCEFCKTALSGFFYCYPDM